MKRIDEIVALSEERDRRVSPGIAKYLSSLEAGHPTKALVLLRAIALAGLPRQKTSKTSVTRILRFGADEFVKVVYQTQPGGTLPFGRDRVMLMIMMHAAAEQRERVVELGRATELMERLGLGSGSRGGSNYRRLRESFARLAGMNMSYRIGRSLEELDSSKPGAGGWFPMIMNYDLRESVGSRNQPWQVSLSSDFLEHLMDRSSQMLMPVDLIREFEDRPLTLDLALLLVSRCGAARSQSVLTDEVLYGLFGEREDLNPAKKRVLKKRLLEAHEAVMKATGGRLAASIVQRKDGRKIRWSIAVGPSDAVVIPFSKKAKKALNSG